MDEKEINRFVRDVVSGGIYLLNTEEKIERAAALFIVTGWFKKVTKEEIDDMAMLYGRKEDVVSITCNGIPMFTQIGFVNKDDWDKIVKKHEQVEKCLGVEENE